MKNLNFIYIDINLELFKCTQLSKADQELIESMQEEKKSQFLSPQKKRKSENTNFTSPVPPEILAAKIYKNILINDSRFANLTSKQSKVLIQHDKILRTQIVLKIKAELAKDVSDENLTNTLGFDFADIDPDLEQDVIDTQEFFDLQQ